MMIGPRLKQLRLARGLSLDALVLKMGGVVTKQAISKYELGKSQPLPKVVNRLASALGVKANQLWSEPNYGIEFIAYGKSSTLPKKEQAYVENLVKEEIEKRIRLQEVTNQTSDPDLLIRQMSVKRLEDADMAADTLRKNWNLGTAPIASVCDVLEDHRIYILEINANEKFDGIAAVASDEHKKTLAASVVTRKGVCGERQRMSLCHELGHLVLDVNKAVDEEKAAFRFATAFLAPAVIVRQEVGVKRTFIQMEELMIFKKRFGMSIQAFLYRLRELEIITDSHCSKWFKDINRFGWKKREPNETQPEQPQWLKQNVLRAVSEDRITPEEGERILSTTLKKIVSPSLANRRTFLGLPIEERREILRKQAEKIHSLYENDKNWRTISAGDIVEY